jgi:tRNA A37 threonylcarbamoyladenosine dehydratase
MSESEHGAPQRYASIIVIGGGCYGTYYVRQLQRAARAGALEAREIVVVDRDAACAVARDRAVHQAEGPLPIRITTPA